MRADGRAVLREVPWGDDHQNLIPSFRHKHVLHKHSSELGHLSVRAESGEGCGLAGLAS